MTSNPLPVPAPPRSTTGPAILATFVLLLNVIFTSLAVTWSAYWYIQLEHATFGFGERLLLLGGSAILLVSQFLIAFLVSISAVKHNKGLGADFREWICWTGIYGMMISTICLLGVLAYSFIGDHKSPGVGSW